MLLSDMKMKGCFLILIVCLFLSCAREKKKAVFYDSGIEMFSDSLEQYEKKSLDYERLTDGDIISVPYVEKAGVKYVNVSVNGFGFEMIFDTGCSGTLISVAEANYLYQKGYLTNEDILGVAQSQIADGSIVVNTVINLKEVVIDGKITCPNVTATVSDNNNAPLLLGNEVLDRVAAYSVDNVNKVINFKLK